MRFYGHTVVLVYGHEIVKLVLSTPDKFLILPHFLSIYCISTAFAYGFHLLPASLQKAAFHSVKGCLSEGKRPRIEG